MNIEEIAESITELVLEQEDLSEHAYRTAEDVSGCDRVDLESVEGTIQHRLFYSIYAEEQIRIVNIVLQKLLSHPKKG